MKKIILDLWQRTKPYRFQLFGGTLSLFIFSIIETFRPYFLKIIIDKYIPQKSINLIWKMSFLYLMMLLFSFLFSFLFSYFLSAVGYQVVNSLKADLFKNILNLDREFFSKNSVGSLLARIESDTEVLKDLFSGRMGRVVSLVFLLGGILVSLFLNIGIAGILFFVYSLLICWILYKLLGPIRYYFEQVREAYRKLSSFLAEYLKGVSLIRFYQVEDKVKEKLRHFNREKYQVEKKASLLNYSSMAFLYFISSDGIGTILIIYFGISALAHQKLTLGSIIMMLQYLRMFFRPFIHFSQEILSLQSSFVALNRVYEYLALRPEIKSGNRNLRNNQEITIEFSHVWFAYKGEEWVLKDVSFKIRPQEKIGLVGESGAGKSTIFKLLLRFYEVQKGEILLNGINIKEFKLEDLRGLFSLITQESNFFYGEIRENLTMLSEIEDEKIWEVVKRLELEELFKKFSPDLNKIIADGGKNFSSGERQLLAFVRAMLFERKIFLLDEATAFVDRKTESSLHQALTKIVKDKTLLVIAHRLSTVEEMDKILVFKKGKLIESGNHQQLLEKKGEYWRLINSHRKEEILDDRKD